jgi:hypothetical protein
MFCGFGKLDVGVIRRNCRDQTAIMVHVLAPLSQAVEEVVNLLASVKTQLNMLRKSHFLASNLSVRDVL